MYFAEEGPVVVPGSAFPTGNINQSDHNVWSIRFNKQVHILFILHVTMHLVFISFNFLSLLDHQGTVT